MKNRLLLTLLVGLHAYCADAQTIDYRFQSVFIYNFAKNTQWPPANASSELIIGILGNARVSEQMATFFADKNLYSRKIQVRSFSSVDQLAYCHILFIPTSNKNNLAQILEKVGTQPTLIVTEREGWGKQGSLINFIVTDEGKLKFELNKEAVRKHSLNVSTDLQSLAILL